MVLKILVPYDGSSESDNVQEEAIDIAQAFNGSITLQHVFWVPIEIKNEKMIEITDNIDPRDKVSLRMFSAKEDTLEKCARGTRYLR